MVALAETEMIQDYVWEDIQRSAAGYCCYTEHILSVVSIEPAKKKKSLFSLIKNMHRNASFEENIIHFFSCLTK